MVVISRHKATRTAVDASRLAIDINAPSSIDSMSSNIRSHLVLPDPEANEANLLIFGRIGKIQVRREPTNSPNVYRRLSKLPTIGVTCFHESLIWRLSYAFQSAAMRNADTRLKHKKNRPTQGDGLHILKLLIQESWLLHQFHHRIADKRGVFGIKSHKVISKAGHDSADGLRQKSTSLKVTDIR